MGIGLTRALVVLALAGCTLPVPLTAQDREVDRLAESARVLTEILDASDKSIPKAILDRARAIAVFPSTIKGAFLVGAQRGKGIISGRARGVWSPPAFVTVTGGSFGLQIGGQATDIVLVVMNDRGLENLAQNSFKIGGDASVAAGPVGREATAATDYKFTAEILSYSRSKGLFAGISLAGATIRADRDANKRIYGTEVDTRQVVIDSKVSAPAAAGPWMKVLSGRVK